MRDMRNDLAVRSPVDRIPERPLHHSHERSMPEHRTDSRMESRSDLHDSRNDTRIENRSESHAHVDLPRPPHSNQNHLQLKDDKYTPINKPEVSGNMDNLSNFNAS